MHALVGYSLIGMFVAMIAVAYLLPTLIAWARHTHGLAVVAIVNIAIGWTLVGWLVALLLAVRRPPVVVQIVNQIQPPGHR